MIMSHLSVAILVAGRERYPHSLRSLHYPSPSLVCAIMTFTHLPSLTIYANIGQYSDGDNDSSSLRCLFSRVSSRWRHTTRRGRVTRARWSSSSQAQTDPAVPAGLSSEKSCPTASRWLGVSISYQFSFSLSKACSWASL